MSIVISLPIVSSFHWFVYSFDPFAPLVPPKKQTLRLYHGLAWLKPFRIL